MRTLPFLALAVLLALAAPAAAAPPTCPPTIHADVEPGQQTPLWPYGCSDPDNDFLEVELVDDAAHGEVIVTEPPTTFLYTPDAGYSGPDAFTFRVRDATEASADSTFELTVLAPNTPPGCVPVIQLRVEPGGTLPLDHLNACSDPDGDPIFPVLLAGPLHGIITFAGMSPAYRPFQGYTGPDRIDYLVRDMRGGESAPAAVEITVAGAETPAAPAATGTPPPATAPPDRTAPAVASAFPSGQRLGRVRARGLKVELRSSEAGRARVELFVDKRTARALGLRRRPAGPVRIGAAERDLSAGATTMTVPLTSKARRALRGVRSVRVRLVAAVTDAAGNRRDHVRVLTLRR